MGEIRSWGVLSQLRSQVEAETQTSLIKISNTENLFKSYHITSYLYLIDLNYEKRFDIRLNLRVIAVDFFFGSFIDLIFQFLVSLECV